MLNEQTKQAQLNKALLALVEHPQCTSLELARKKGLDRHFLARRLPDLLESGYVAREKKRHCKVSKIKSMSFEWTPTALGRAKAEILLS